MSALGRLVASIVLDTAEFSKGADKAQYEAAKAAAAIEKHFDGLNKKVDSSFKGMAASMAAGLGVGALVAWAKHSLEAADETGKLAQKAGVAIEEFSKLAYAAKLSDVSTESLQKGIKGLSETMTKAADATSKEAALMKSLGVDFKGNVSEAISKVADTFAKLPDGATKATLATTLFGKAGMDMIPFLNQGSAGIAKLKDEAEKLGLVMGGEAAKAAEQFNDNMKALSSSSEKLAITFVNDVAPMLAQVTDHLKEAYIEGGKLHMIWVALGAVGTAIFTDDMLTDAQKANKEIAALEKEIKQLRATMNGSASVAEARLDWFQSLPSQLTDATNKLSDLRAKKEAVLAASQKEKEIAEAMAGLDAIEGQALEDQMRKQLAINTAAKDQVSSLKDIDKLLGEIAAKEAGQDGGFGEKVGKLTFAMQVGVISAQQYTVALGQLYAQSPLVAKGLKDEADAVKHLADMRDRLKEQEIEEIAARDQVINALEDSVEQLKVETATLGMTADQRDLYLLGLEKESALKSAITDKDVEYINKLVGEKKALIESRAMGQSQLQIWGELSDRAGAFFGDLVVNGASAFDRLKQSLKSFAAELVALFAKRWVLQMIAGVTGSTSMSALAATAGNGSTAGSMLNILGSAGGVFGTSAAYAAAVPGLSSFGAGSQAAMLAAQTGEFGAAGLSATAAAGGSGMLSTLATAAPYIAAIIAAYALIKKFGDKGENPKAQLGFGAGAQAYVTNGVFGAEGFKSIQTNDDFNQGLRAYMASFKGMDEALAKMLTDSQKERIAAALGSSAQREFAFPKGDGTAGEQLSLEYLKQKYSIVFGELDKKFAEFVLGFTGSAEDLGKAIAEESAAIEMLTSDSTIDMLKKIPNLTIDGLRAMQAAGESLSQTFQRVVGEFLAAENNLNQAIGARNPQFARDLVLSQRNSVGVQFASSIGQSYGAGLATQMALNPQSFTGLNTEQMNLLANWLTLQTTLEQLDAQLANVAGPSGSLSNFGSALDSTASQMAGAKLSLAGYLNGLNQSSLSPLTPTQKYIAAKQVFNQQAALAEGGNLDAIAGLSSYHQAFLTASQAVNASSGAYNADYFSSYARLNAISGGQAQNPLTAGVYSAGVQAMGTQIIALQASVQQITATLQSIYNGPIPVEVVNGDDVGAPIAAALDPRAAGAPLG